MNFVMSLEEQGADLHKVQISKAEVALWGLEKWKKAQKRRSALIEKTKSEISNGVEKVKTKVPSPTSLLPRHDHSINWKTDILHGRKTR